MASISSLIIPPPNLLSTETHLTLQSKLPTFQFNFPKLSYSAFHLKSTSKDYYSNSRLFAVAEETSVDTSSEFARKLYIGNIPRNIDNDELAKIVQEHCAVEKAEVISFDAFAQFVKFGTSI